MLAGVLRPSAGDARLERRERGARPRAGEALDRLHVAALRPLRRPHRGREPRLLRRPLPRAARRAAGAARAPLPLLRARPVPVAARRPALGRHEAEARPLLLPHPRARDPAARRAHLRRGPDLAARPLAHRARDGGARHHRGGEHRLHGRGRALRPAGHAAPRPAGGARHRRARCSATSGIEMLAVPVDRVHEARARRPRPCPACAAPRSSATGCTSPWPTPRADGPRVAAGAARRGLRGRRGAHRRAHRSRTCSSSASRGAGTA